MTPEQARVLRPVLIGVPAGLVIGTVAGRLPSPWGMAMLMVLCIAGLVWVLVTLVQLRRDMRRLTDLTDMLQADIEQEMRRTREAGYE